MGCIVKADEYRKMIILLINKMSDEEMLKRIFEYVHSQYIKKIAGVSLLIFLWRIFFLSISENYLFLLLSWKGN